MHILIARTPFCALGFLFHLFASSSDWFDRLGVSAVAIGQSNYFAFGFKTLAQVNTALIDLIDLLTNQSINPQ